MTTKATREGEGEGGEELDIKVRPKYAATQRAMRRRRRKAVVEIPRHVGQKNARPSGSVRHAELHLLDTQKGLLYKMLRIDLSPRILRILII